MNSGYTLLSGSVNSSTLYSDLIVESAINFELIDINKKRYYDLRSGLWNVSLGYDENLYSDVIRCFSDLLGRGIPYLDIQSYKNPLYEEVSKKLLDFVGIEDFKKVFFTNSGSESMELAIKIAQKSCGKNGKIVTFNDSYHGNFFGGMAVSGLDALINNDYSLLKNNIIYLPFPDNVEKCQYIIDYIEENYQDIMFFVMEPIIASGGLNFSNSNFFNKLLKILKERNIISIFDEVATGFYRTGNRFYLTNLEEKPDILCLSKSINNGITPLGAVLFSKEIERKLIRKDIEHFSTQNGNLLGMVSAKITIDYFIKYEKEIFYNVNLLEKSFNKIAVQYNLKYKSKGAMASIEINSPHLLNLIEELKNIGVLVYIYSDGRNNGITLFPILTMTAEKYASCVNIIFKKGLHYA
ncbi:aminotransferase class III-fold pyridoxal phosphate-dependent enzyme [Carnobacterium gallinarum]|uniref:aminotransferase class III-fold pyridoxal phosphate-dependent enzyme n=1 Tax=Carnobacterium gallinarum TaxID=2749 RepID=UPI00054D40C4|nr:aminotransferase class III-fold pyridoxal phosphate-dependent enzyme [Carnobacterium gallinarum]